MPKRSPLWYLLYEQLSILFPDMGTPVLTATATRLEHALLTKEAS